MRVGRQGMSIQKQKEVKRSQTGTRTRVCWVRASYPNHLDYLGSSEHTRHTHKHKHKQNNTHTHTHTQIQQPFFQPTHSHSIRSIHSTTCTLSPAHSHLHLSSPPLFCALISIACKAEDQFFSIRFHSIRSKPNRFHPLPYHPISHGPDPIKTK